MKATGIVRRIDDLGRVVIPKEIRRTMRIREGDPLEIYTDKDGEVIFKKYSPMGELASFATQMCDTLSKTTGNVVVICDRDVVIALSGVPRKELVDKRVSEDLERMLESRQMYQYKAGDRKIPVTDGQERHFVGIAAPILAEGDISGSVLFLLGEDGNSGTETEYKLAQTVAAFLGKQMES
ncbi:MAG: AbrB/MazE/SpoVT family DNA-binding domain-containing protein [Oscillospiraceae bacterium]|jgi:AbrB family transcriptional regulator (stage V sporulation protein T)|nr:AbrB/MazE/SpoVT family DNA-binding domain-containing protein [Oscillospiraceae bacterium]